MNIKFGRGCFGSFVEIDGEDLVEDQDINIKPDNAQEKVINLLKLNKDNLDSSDWLTILEIIVSRDSSFIYDDDNSHSSTCDQCGDYNETHIYNK